MLGSLLASFRGDRDQEDEESGGHRGRRPSMLRRRSSGSVASRGATSTRSRDDEDDLRQGGGGWSDEDYGSEDDEEDDSDDSLRSGSSDGDARSIRGVLLPSAFGPLSGAVDPVFGDSRAGLERDGDELDAELAGRDPEDHAGASSGFAGGAPGEVDSGIGTAGGNAAASDLAYLDKSSRSRQQIYLADEDALIRLTGYRTRPARRAAYLVFAWLTVGIVYLLARWMPRWRLRWMCRETVFEEAEFLMIEVSKRF